MVEDSAPAEYKKYSIQYYNLKGMETICWPAHSLDINLIEVLWLDIENELGETWGRIGDMSTLEVALNTV